MLKNDLFPRDFIYALEPPSNYFGPQAIFGDEPRRDIIRSIEDADILFPPRHKSILQVNALPESLFHAARVFLLSTTLRDLRGEGPTHRSMLVNVSHYTNVQEQVVGLHTWLSQVQQDVRNYNQLDSREALRNNSLSDLKNAWELEFSDSEFTWEQVQIALVEGILPVSLKAVNQRTGRPVLTSVSTRRLAFG